MANGVDTANDLFEAIKLISEASLTNLKYDKTSLCTVVKKINQYRYQVQDGEMKFEAIYDGTDKFKEGDSVYVTIPNGDYSESFKRIVGNEKRSKINEDITQYKSPLDSMVDFVDIKKVNYNTQDVVKQIEVSKEIKVIEDIDISFLKFNFGE